MALNCIKMKHHWYLKSNIRQITLNVQRIIVKKSYYILLWTTNKTCRPTNKPKCFDNNVSHLMAKSIQSSSQKKNPVRCGNCPFTYLCYNSKICQTLQQNEFTVSHSKPTFLLGLPLHTLQSLHLYWNINCQCSYTFVKKNWLKQYLIEINLTVSPDLNKNAFCQE